MQKPTDDDRILRAFAISPLIGVFIGDLIITTLYFKQSLLHIGILTMIGCYIAYPSVILIGLFLLILKYFFKLRKILSFWLVLLIGVLTPSILWYIFFRFGTSSSIRNMFADPSAFPYGIFGLVSGIIGALCFWYIGIRKSHLQ